MDSLDDYAAALNYLFAEVHPAEADPRTVAEVAAALSAAAPDDPLVPTAGEIDALRTGTATRPNPRHLDLLAGFFGVPVEYFHDAKLMAEVNEQIHLLTLIRDQGVRRVLICRRGSSEEDHDPVADRRMLIEVLERTAALDASGHARDESSLVTHEAAPPRRPVEGGTAPGPPPAPRRAGRRGRWWGRRRQPPDPR